MMLRDLCLHFLLLVATRWLSGKDGPSLQFVESSNPGENDELQTAILKDFFSVIPVSDKCMEGARNAVTNFELSYLTPVPSRFDKRYLKHEKELFLLSMSDPSPENRNQTWTFRLGRGGNVYSFIGAYGEAIPPQNHDNSPFNDEVWQLGANAVGRKNMRSHTYDIHQSGAYLRDKLPKPYFSPTLAVHCEGNQCLVASHGTHAHVPTIHSHSVIFFSRYANCGGGVIEMSSMMYNVKYSALEPDKITTNRLDWLSAPWGGVRRSTLNDMIITKTGGDPSVEGGDVWQVLRPLPNFGSPKTTRPLKGTAGYTIFTQSLENPDLDTKFPMPTKMVEEEIEDEGDKRGGQKDHDKGDAHFANATASAVETCDAGVCAIDSSILSSDQAKKPPTQRKKRHKRKKTLRLVASQQNAVRDAKRKTPDGIQIYHMPIEETIQLSEGYWESRLLFHNPQRRKAFLVERVINWSHRGRILAFASRVSLEELNERVGKGDEIRVYYWNGGKPKENNLGLSIVHGQDKSHKQKFDQDDFFRFGGTYFLRDFTVITLISRDIVKPGELWFKRQYFITDSLLELGPKSREWRSLVVKDRRGEKRLFRELPKHSIYLFASSDQATVGVSLREELSSCSNAAMLICTGSTTPSEENDGNMIYSVTCGDDDFYIGPKLYVFSPKDDRDDVEHKIVRLHECRNKEKGVFPNIRFLGFFEKGSCDSVSDAKYDPAFCESTVRDEL